MNTSLVNVGVAQIKIATSPTVLRTILGSCIGICVYDRIKKIGGLAHILLPDGPSNTPTPEKFASTAIPQLVQLLMKEGAKKENLSAKIAGGASMFKFASNVSLGQIGSRNIKKTQEVLESIGIAIVEVDTGGNAGRVIDFYLEDGRLKIKSAGKEKMFYKV